MTDDYTVTLGRETFGFPKKIAQIEFEQTAQEVHGWTDLSGRCNAGDAAATFADESGADGSMLARCYNFTSSPAANGQCLDYPPRLVLNWLVQRPTAVEVGAAYARLTLTLSLGEVVAEADSFAFLPYTAARIDRFMPAGRLGSISGPA